ncbi:MAG: hypothetical protein NC313_15985 [Butyrivibrio sp.]|nr:hypothetical protein [Butyrivibrio sp.]
MSYTNLKDYAKNMDIHEGDTVFISSDARIMMWDALTNKVNADLNLFIDGILEQLGGGRLYFQRITGIFAEGKRSIINQLHV